MGIGTALQMTSPQQNPSKLDLAEVDAVLADIRTIGFCVVPNLIPDEICAHARAEYTRILQVEKEENLHPSGHQRILHLLMKHPIFITFLMHPFVLAVWRRYLGEDMICSTLTGNALWPDSTELYWHVDHPYWTMAQPYPVYPLSGQAIWMLDDFTVANGATAGIPGSHLRPFLPMLEDCWTEEATILTGQRGSAILADGAWWHTSRPNQSTDTRCAVLTTFIRSYCVTQEDMRMQLSALDDPPAEVAHLLGADQYVPRRTFPY
jgi:ectoine hydroxylase-related dioxygenase (phytanoyl-CoA dioxygenase family)